MTFNELRRYQDILTARIAELERLVSRRDLITVETSPDQLDDTQLAAQRTLAVSNLDRGFSHLRSAREALRRIEEGSFGTCQECEEDIHPKRLAAVPWASLCIRCQEALDNNADVVQIPTRVPLRRAA